MTPFVFTVPVRFADVDHAGIVYYPRFFHYFHLAFEELFRQRIGGRAYVDLLDKDRVGFPAVRAEAEYRAPLKFGDTAEIELTVERLGKTSRPQSKARPPKESPDGNVTQATRREVFERDGEQCTFADAQGRRCKLSSQARARPRRHRRQGPAAVPQLQPRGGRRGRRRDPPPA